MRNELIVLSFKVESKVGPGLTFCSRPPFGDTNAKRSNAFSRFLTTHHALTFELCRNHSLKLKGKLADKLCASNLYKRAISLLLMRDFALCVLV